LERDADMVAAVRDRCDGIGGGAEIGDARDFKLGMTFSLVLAPMQLIQLFEDRSQRIACLGCTRESMAPGAHAAFAIVEERESAPASVTTPLADVRAIGGWVYASLPLGIAIEGDRIRLRRLRRTVDPKGATSEVPNEVDLQAIAADELEAEAEEA